MATLQSVTDKIRGLIDAANSVTGNNDTDLTKAVGTLIAGYNQGGTGEFCRYVTFMGIDNETVEDTVTIAPHYSCPKSAAPLLIKESTDDTNYVHVGWSLTPEGEAEPYILNNIREDIILYPVFEASVRHYTVRFWDGDKLCGQKQIPYGGSSDYTYHKVAHYFQHWTPEPVNVTSDMDCYGTWEMASFAKDSWKQISDNCKAGNAAEYYKVGDDRVMRVEYGDVYDGTTGDDITLRVAHIDDKGGMYVITGTPYRSSKMVYEADHDRDTNDPYAVISYVGSDVYEYLQQIYYDGLPGDMYSAITSVKLHLTSEFRGGFSNTDELGILLGIWPLSKTEVFGTAWDGDTRYGGFDIFKTDINEEEGFYGKSDARVIRLTDGTAVPWMLRDPHSYNTIDVVQTDGSLRQWQVDTDEAYVVFGFYIGQR